METHTTHSEGETAGLGAALSSRLRPGDTVAVYGGLGAGKTRFVQGICRGLGVREHVASPTFTIINEYRTGSVDIYHFDLYRVNTMAELRELGFEEYCSGDGICLVEWAERARDVLPARRYDVSLDFGGTRDAREIRIEEQAGIAA